MTLGGFTIAIGALVDDAIIDVENVFRRLRQERAKPEASGGRRSRSSSAPRPRCAGAILFATLIIVLVFLPLFVLPGIEGRLLRPLGFAYVAALAGSLLVSLTVTPVLCYLLLPRERLLDARRALAAAHVSRRATRATSSWRLAPPAGRARRAARPGRRRRSPSLPFLGRSFLPPFNEGSSRSAS